jgi:uncharacterized protein (DUF433 family)
MALKTLPVNTDDLIREYQAGRSVKEIARQFSVSEPLIYQRMRKAGVPTRGKRLDVPVIELLSRYRAGESEKALSEALGVSRPAIRRRLLEAGITPRDGSASMYLRMAGTTPEQRADLSRAAHDAVRGKRQSDAHRCAIATTRQRLQSGTSPGEMALAEMLAARGIPTVPQQAIGPYNCDLGAYPVAVEVFGGSWHWSGRHILRAPERFRYILNASWDILAVKIEVRRHPLTSATADYVAAYIESARRDPARRREYRVIRGAGETLTAGSADDDDLTLIAALHRRSDAGR